MKPDQRQASRMLQRLLRASRLVLSAAPGLLALGSLLAGSIPAAAQSYPLVAGSCA